MSLAMAAGAAITPSAVAQEATEEETSFLDAAMDGEVQLVKELLDKGVDVNVTYDEDGINALIQAAVGSHVEVVKVLLAAGANVDAKDAEGMTAFLAAVDACGNIYGDLEVEEPYWEVMRLLAGAGADVNATNGEGQTAMAIAESYEGQRAKKILTELGAK
jgi:ankyrin repeat protein